MSVAASTSTVSNARKRCELACRPCRHRKIKCQNSMPNQLTCDSCRAKGKDPNECKYIPVAEDYPPARPRQSPPAAIHPSYTYQIAPTSPIREPPAPIPHSPPQSAYYTNAYTPHHYPAPQASPPHYSSPPPVQLQTVNYPTYSQPASPERTFSDGASGMVAPDMGYSTTWVPQLQIPPGYASPGPVSPSVPVAQDVWPASASDQMQDPSAYYDQVPASPAATYAHAPYQQPSHQYQYASYSNLNNGSYYTGSP